MVSLSRLLNGFSKGKARRRPVAPRLRPALDVLEDRCCPSTVSSIAANFNGTAIPAGDTVWFSSVFQASGLPKTSAVTVHVENGSIDFNVGTTP